MRKTSESDSGRWSANESVKESESGSGNEGSGSEERGSENEGGEEQSVVHGGQVQI